MLDKIYDIIAEQLDIEKDMITPDSSILEDLGADSLDLIELVSLLEEEFNIEVEDEKVAELKTPQSIAKYIEEKK